ncbi:MAG TPA: DsrE family protein [Streptosporangiaceae bacterium]
MAARILAVIERGQQGGSDERYRDLLYFCVGVRTQFKSMDLVLVGAAVACAVSTAAEPPPGGPPAPQQYLRTLIRTGVRVWVDGPDLAASGHSAGSLLAGATAVDTDTLATGWHEYEEVWFL